MSLASLSRHLRTLGDPVRLRILALITDQALSVKELCEVLNLGQSRVSGHLARLLEEGLASSRRAGRCTLYAAGERPGSFSGPALEDLRGTSEAQGDQASLLAVLARREQGPPPGTLGSDYLPGRTWEGFARALLALLPPLRIADLGIGKGELSLLLARGAERVIAVDRDAELLARTRQRARAAGLENMDFRVGDLRAPPLACGEANLWMLSQVLHLVPDPARALASASRLLDPGGRIVVLDLLAHDEVWVRASLAHMRLGFAEGELQNLLGEAGFTEVSVERVARDRKPPHFVTILGVGKKPEHD